jgi:predicted nucleotidyltransferase component of viral defense system
VIPYDYITEWRTFVPWIHDHQVEQDLIISRAIVEIFSHPELSRTLAFRGGTSLYKLYLQPGVRYSEDIDLVQTIPAPIGATFNALHTVLDHWLGEPKRILKQGRANFIYRMRSEGSPPRLMRLKIEINSAEHFAVMDLVKVPYEVKSRWFTGQAMVCTYPLEELLATKLRALYQRKKGRDLFDLWHAFGNSSAYPDVVVGVFIKYMLHEKHPVSRAEFELNLESKLSDPVFTADIGPLLAPNTFWDAGTAAGFIKKRLLSLLPGGSWKGGR